MEISIVPTLLCIKYLSLSLSLQVKTMADEPDEATRGHVNIDAMGLEHEFVDGAIKIAHQPTYKLCEAPGTYSVDAEELER